LIVIWSRGAKVNGKALERRTALVVSAWPAPLSPLGFSASVPITITGLLVLFHAINRRGASLEWVEST
jgi:putative effector of murein hydrolase LrgA (UPF0299 family)